MKSPAPFPTCYAFIHIFYFVLSIEAKGGPNAHIDDIIQSKIDPTLPILYRERNGWCVHSARLWLAMEEKCVRFNAVLVEARGDTYDGSPTQDERDNTDGRPEC